MATAKIINSGPNQVIQLPNEYKIPASEMFVQKIGSTIILMEKEDRWQTFLDGVNGFTDDFFCDGREEYIEVNREEF